jgi:hydroxymethylbilane synthase
VETRLRKLEEVPYDAVILAAAGLHRLGLQPAGATVLEPEEMLPAVGQGILGIEAREDDAATRRLLAPLDHPATRAAGVAERAFLAAIGGSCTTPLAAYARFEAEGRLRLDALVATPDGRRVLRHGQAMVAQGTPRELGQLVADWMLARAAAEIVKEGRVA